MLGGVTVDSVFTFMFNSVLLGIGLSMDAFSVSLANGLSEPKMHPSKMYGIAGVFAVFQALMPMLGWICVKTVVSLFSAFKSMIPWIALILLLYIGIKMLVEGIRAKDEESDSPTLGLAALLLQGIATSIDALSVGFTIAEYDFIHALSAALIIGGVTFAICFAGLIIGKKFGTKLAHKADILGGIILIIIGIEIFINGII